MLGEYARAESYLKRSLAVLTAGADFTARGKSLMNLGRLRELQEDRAGAATLLQQAAALLKDSPDTLARADIATNLGQLQFSRGDLRGAFAQQTEAQALYRSVHNAVGLANADRHAAIVLAGLGETDRALDNLREALQLEMSGGLLDNSTDTLVEMARIQLRTGAAAAARDSLEQAIQVGDRLRLHVASADLRAAYFASKQSAYAEMIDLLVQLHDRGGPADLLARALEVEERSRSRSLLDVLASRRDGLLRGAGADVLADERRVVRTFSFKSQQLAQLPDKPDSAAQRATLLSEVDGLQTEYDRLEGVIAEKEPRQAALATVPPLTIDGIRALLDPDTVLLEFALGGESSYLWVVGAGDLACFRLPGRAAIEALARPVASLAGDRATRLAQPAVERRFRSAAAGLSRMLFAEAAPLLRNKRLALVPDGLLHDVPFAVLPAPDAPALPLGIAHELVSVPSASALAALRRNPPVRAPGGLRVAVLADPVFGGDPRLPAETRGVSQLASLPFSLREADWIQEAARGAQVTRLTGFAAAKHAIAQPRVAGADILHLATHADIDETRPELSAIYFSQADAKGKPLDGLLGLYEIYDLNLPFQLAVLSGCRTGLGKDAGGEGLVGFSRAFFYAGSSRVLMSLWRISDEGTALFMREFYRKLMSSGLAPGEALRAAREALYRDPRWRDPSYWSGFVLEGEWRPLALGEGRH